MWWPCAKTSLVSKTGSVKTEVGALPTPSFANSEPFMDATEVANNAGECESTRPHLDLYPVGRLAQAAALRELCGHGPAGQT